MDRRDRANNGEFRRPGWTEDWHRMTITIEVENDEAEEGEDDIVEYTIPAVAEVCPTCSGRGSYVNPAIDADHGITAEEMYEMGEEFEEAYFGGAYDQVCAECNGKRVVLELSEEWLERHPDVAKRIEREERWRAEDAMCAAAERRMGY